MIIKRIKGIFETSFNKIKYKENRKYIPLFWYKNEVNFGDLLSPIILNHFLDKKVLYVIPKYFKHAHFMALGSVLHNASKNTIVWGSGFVSSNSRCYQFPQKVLAVRGPKTREKLLEQSIPCPEIYGDPALLLPEIYYPRVKTKYELGIIPHYVDADHEFIGNFKSGKDVKILNVRTSDPFRFIDDLLSCETIASSSLHGLIVADAYRIPSTWIKFSDNVFGEGFKFQDYFLSVKKKIQKPLVINNDTRKEDLINSASYDPIDIDLNLLRSVLLNEYLDR